MKDDLTVTNTKSQIHLEPYVTSSQESSFQSWLQVTHFSLETIPILVTLINFRKGNTPQGGLARYWNNIVAIRVIVLTNLKELNFYNKKRMYFYDVTNNQSFRKSGMGPLGRPPRKLQILRDYVFLSFVITICNFFV